MELEKTERGTPSDGFPICGICTTANPSGQRYCGHCGNELSTSLRRLRADTQSTAEGPRVQVTFLYGAFGTPKGSGDAASGPAIKRLMGRLRLVIIERGAAFEDLGQGRFSATLGTQEPSEEDPLMAVSIGLRLLRLALASPEALPLHLVATTGRIPSRSLIKPPKRETDAEGLLLGHELLRSSGRFALQCPAGSLLVDSLTFRMVRDQHRCQRLPVPPSELRPQPLYEVLSSVDMTHVTYEPPLVGRGKEKERILKVWSRVELGEGPIFLTLTGDLGIGKTGLLREIIRSLALQATLFKNPRQRRRIDRWRRTPYSYFGEILRTFFDLHEADEDEINRQKLIKGILTTLRSPREGMPREIAHALGLFCQMEFRDVPQDGAAEEAPAQREQRAFSAFCRYLEQLGQIRPVLFVLDDLYSADPSSLRLLKYLTTHLEATPILFICSSRLSLLNELEKEESLAIPGERILLKPLAEADAAALIDALLPQDIKLPQLLRERILSLAEGNPYFLRETIRDLAEQSLLEAVPEGGIESIEIPGNLEGILQARLSRLSPEERDLLQKGAVFGKIFWRGAVEMLYRQETELAPGWRLKDGEITNRADDLEATLEHLTHQGVLQFQNPSIFESEAQYAFVPGLLQELCYEEIPKEIRPPYHRMAGQWIEMMTRGRTQDFAPELAHHFEEGEEPARAALFHLEAGMQAFKIFSPKETVLRLEKALEHLDGSLMQRRAEATRTLAEALIHQGEYSRALGLFEHLLLLSWRMGHRQMAGEIYARIGWIFFLKRDFAPALEHFKNAHTLHQETGWTRGIAMALSHMGKVYTVLGEYEQARLYLQEALDLRRELGNPGDLAWTLNDMGNLLLEQGALTEARKFYKDSLELRLRLGNPQPIIQSTNNLALLHLLQGLYDEAKKDLLASLEQAQRSGDLLAMSVILVNLGELYIQTSDIEKASESVERATDLAEKLGDKMILAECYRLGGELFLLQGEGIDALECCGTAYKIITERGIRSALSSIYRLMGQVYASIPQEILETKGKSEGDRAGLPDHLFGQALACFEEAISIAHNHGNLREEAKSRMELGIYEVHHKNPARGRYQLDQAKSLFERLGMAAFVKETTRILHEVDQLQLVEEEAASEPFFSFPPPSSGATPLVAQTIQFRVTFDDEDIGPLPTPAVLSPEEKVRLTSVEKAVSPDDIYPRPLEGRMKSRTLDLPELEGLRQATPPPDKTAEVEIPSPSSVAPPASSLPAASTSSEAEDREAYELLSVDESTAERPIVKLDPAAIAKPALPPFPTLTAPTSPSSDLLRSTSSDRLPAFPSAPESLLGSLPPPSSSSKPSSSAKPSTSLPKMPAPLAKAGATAQASSTPSSKAGTTAHAAPTPLPSPPPDPKEKPSSGNKPKTGSSSKAEKPPVESKPKAEASSPAKLDVSPTAPADGKSSFASGFSVTGFSIPAMTPDMAASITARSNLPPAAPSNLTPAPVPPSNPSPVSIPHAGRTAPYAMPSTSAPTPASAAPLAPTPAPAPAPPPNLPPNPPLHLTLAPALAPAAPSNVPSAPVSPSANPEGGVKAPPLLKMPPAFVTPAPVSTASSPVSKTQEEAWSQIPEAFSQEEEDEDDPKTLQTRLPETIMRELRKKDDNLLVEEGEDHDVVESFPVEEDISIVGGQEEKEEEEEQKQGQGKPKPRRSGASLVRPGATAASLAAVPSAAILASFPLTTTAATSSSAATPPTTETKDKSGIFRGVSPQDIQDADPATTKDKSGVFRGVAPHELESSAPSDNPMSFELSFDDLPSSEEASKGIDAELFSPLKPKSPSVYDSQMIIAQVAQDDPISRDWFEEGRSDRSKEFWKKHPEDLQEVREEMRHEKIIEELDGGKKKAKPKKS